MPVTATPVTASEVGISEAMWLRFKRHYEICASTRSERTRHSEIAGEFGSAGFYRVSR